MSFSKFCSAFVTSAPAQSVDPSHRPLYASVPSELSRTVSKRWTWVHVVAIDSAVLPDALT
jgi:hypothetical protein